MFNRRPRHLLTKKGVKMLNARKGSYQSERATKHSCTHGGAGSDAPLAVALPHKAGKADQLRASLLNVRVHGGLKRLPRVKVLVRHDDRRNAGGLGALQSLRACAEMFSLKVCSGACTGIE